MSIYNLYLVVNINYELLKTVSLLLSYNLEYLELLSLVVTGSI